MSQLPLPLQNQTTTVNPDGSLSIVRDYGKNEDGTPARSQWDVAPGHITALLRDKTKGSLADLMKPGELSAAQDAAAQADQKS
jgi:hypothetical protein